MQLLEDPRYDLASELAKNARGGSLDPAKRLGVFLNYVGSNNLQVGITI